MSYCTTYLDWVLAVSIAAMILALLIGLGSALIGLYKVWLERKTPAQDGEPRRTAGGAAMVEAVRGLVEALANAPAWFALFLAGVLLFWMADQAVGGACKPGDDEQAETPDPQPRVPPVTRATTPATTVTVAGRDITVRVTPVTAAETPKQ